VKPGPHAAATAKGASDPLHRARIDAFMGEVVELVPPTTAALSALACARGHYLIRRRCRRVGPDWYRNVVWRQNIYCHRRTGWLSNDEPAMMTGAKGPPTSHHDDFEIVVH
jgi:hypothetical protein